MTALRLARLLLAAAWACQCGTPAAHAVSPPPVDEKWLPAAALPLPTSPTVQREVCAVPTSGKAESSAQLADLDLPQIWQLTRGAGQRVAVIDTGVHRHPRLKDLVGGGDYVSTGDGTQDCDAHGTLIAGIIAASQDSEPGGFSGLAPDVTLISIRQSSSRFGPARSGAGSGVGDVQTMAKAVRTAADLGASVINISSVACVPATAALDDRALGAALAYAVDVKNAVVVAAAGNTGRASQCPTQPPGATRETVAVVVSPAWYDDYVLTVASVNTQGSPSVFTLAGPWVDVAATGEGVISLSPLGDGLANGVNSGHGPEALSGTSYAAPIVSAVAALIRTRFPTLTARQVMQRIESTAHHPPDGWNPLVGNGTIDVLAAVSNEATPGTIPPRPMALDAQAAPARTPADGRPGDTALAGAAICVVVLLAVAGSSALRGRRSDVRHRPR